MDQKERENRIADAIGPLDNFYKKHARKLPWREEPTPYHVWVSEIMLQQTRVEAVKGYYARFMDALPDVYALATASEDVCNKLWEGLGYYSRVRNLQKAAKVIVDTYGGELPETYEELRKLPGIGFYTAAAIASIAYGKNEAAVDGNILRVVTRLLAEEQDISDQKYRQEIKTLLEDAYQKRDKKKSRAGIYNQAFMDLGATVCIPNGTPLCDKCPLAKCCKAHEEKTELNYPVKVSKKARTIEQKTVLLVTLGEEVLLKKRPEKGLLAGLYEYPCLEGHKTKKEILKALEDIGIQAVKIEKIGSAKHIFTHKEWHMIGYRIKADEIFGKEELTKEGKYLFASISDCNTKYAIPSAYKAFRITEI